MLPRFFKDENGNKFNHITNTRTSLLSSVGHEYTMTEMFLLLILSCTLVNGVSGLGPRCESDQDGSNWK